MYNYKPGQTVIIYNLTPSGKVIVEGKAKLIREVTEPGDDYPSFTVTFEGEYGCHRRTIYPAETA